MTPCFLNSKSASLPVGKNISLGKGPLWYPDTSYILSWGHLGVKCWEGFMEEAMANCSQQFDLALCRVVSRRVFTQLVQTEVRAELLHFHFQPSEMPIVQKKRSMTSQGSAATRAIGAISSPLPSCRVLWLLRLRPCCSHATKMLAPEPAKSFPGQGLLAHPTLWTGRVLWIAVSRGEGWVCPESASLRGLV